MNATNASRQQELVELVTIAREAGEIVRRVYAGDFSASYKQGSEPVTDADRRANEWIVRRLQAAFPGEAIVSEEAAAESYRGFADGTRIFFVDPLDGTREFLHRNGEFSVLIGLVEAERAEFGVVHAPVLGGTWWGARAAGAWASDAAGATRRMGVAATAEPSEARLVVSRSHASPALPAVLEQLACREVAQLGSSGLKGVRVASGEADAYLALGMAGRAWDVCAVDALVSAAGGCFTDALGRELDYRGDLVLRAGILAAAPRLHAAILARLAGIRG